MTSDYQPPCQTSDSPNDWFIERDGRQYNDEPVLATHEVEHIVDEYGPDEDDILEAIEAATEERLAENIVKRRHAKDACHVDCYMRTACLSIGLGPDAPMYGIWGGYYGEELRQIRRERDEHRRRRPGVD